MSADEATKECQECGATIYPEHLERHTAGEWKGKLLCPHCMAEKKELLSIPEGEAGQPAPSEETLEAPIDLVSADEPGQSDTAQIRGFGTGGISFDRTPTSEIEYRRPLLKNSRNATRCRSFHCKLNDASIAYMNQQVNEWIDGQDDLEIKFAVSNIGVLEGKHADPHLITTLFY